MPLFEAPQTRKLGDVKPRHLPVSSPPYEQELVGVEACLQHAQRVRTYLDNAEDTKRTAREKSRADEHLKLKKTQVRLEQLEKLLASTQQQNQLLHKLLMKEKNAGSTPVLKGGRRRRDVRLV